ncbi:MAG: DUF4302 domain-containing protein [Segetibacter sp.]
MKKTLVILLLAIVAFGGCKKNDQSLFNKSPDERLNEALADYQTKLTSATNGWKAFVYPKAGGVYSFYFKFNDANRVQMLSGFDSTSAVTLKESSYRLKALQQPSLLFDTYSYLHVLADPDASVNGGPDGNGFVNGTGLLSDFEFYFDSSSADTINLVGRFNGSKATLMKATPEEAAGLVNGQLATGFLLNKLLTYFKRMTIGSERYDFNVNPTTRTISFVDATGNLLDTLLTTRYYMTFGGIGFIKPLIAGNQIITGISNITYNSSNQTISCTVNNTAASISNVSTPLRIDVNAPRRWWNVKASAYDYWFSISGFHVNGVDDAYHLDTLTAESLPYYFLIYWPKYDTGNDLFGPVFVDYSANSLTLVYGSAPKQPGYASDGRGVFTQLGVYGTYPTTGPAANTAIQLYNSMRLLFCTD